MKNVFERKNRKSEVELDRMAIRSLSSLHVGARATMVNRTHRVVRERAQQMSARRDRVRSLWAPLAVCASLLVILVTAVWSVLDQYELNPTGMPDASDQYMVLVVWFLPVSVGLLAMVWFTRTRGRRSGSEMAR